VSLNDAKVLLSSKPVPTKKVYIHV